jgi:hypothetical protein
MYGALSNQMLDGDWRVNRYVVRRDGSVQLTLYRGSCGCTAIATSPSIVSGLVVPTVIRSSRYVKTLVIGAVS